MKPSIIINGTKYPCYYTMGAGLDFKNETGHDPEAATGSVDNTILLWCCARSACRREGVKFDMSLTDFCDQLTPADIESAVAEMNASAEKKD